MAIRTSVRAKVSGNSSTFLREMNALFIADQWAFWEYESGAKSDSNFIPPGLTRTSPMQRSGYPVDTNCLDTPPVSNPWVMHSTETYSDSSSQYVRVYAEVRLKMARLTNQWVIYLVVLPSP